ncbi:tail spike protein [Vibrio phage K121]
MSDLDNAIKSINESAVKAENTAGFLDDMSTFDDQSSVTNPNNGQIVASIPKQVKDRTDELFAAAESDINQAVSDAAQSATDAQDAANSIGRYQGLWPDSGGSALKGDTYQTQVSGVETGKYFTALQNTTVDPIDDDVNWRAILSNQSLGGLTSYQAANVSDMIAGRVISGEVIPHADGQVWEWAGYYSPNDGGGNKGVVKLGSHTEDNGIIFSIDSNTYVEADTKDGINVLQFGLIPSDHTTADRAQAAYNSGVSKVKWPKRDYIIDAVLNGLNGILVKSNTTTIIDAGSTLTAFAPGAAEYAILDAIQQSNVFFYVEGVEFIGDRSTHTGTIGEQGFGIRIGECDRYVIRGGTYRDFWGDGLFIGKFGAPGSPPSTNGYIRGVLCDNNRRQGMSIVVANGLVVEDSKFLNSNGTSPESGVDSEPNLNDLPNYNITFRNCEFSGTGGGFNAPFSDGTSDFHFYKCIFNGKANQALIGDALQFRSDGLHGISTFNECTFNGIVREAENAIFTHCEFIAGDEYLQTVWVFSCTNDTVVKLIDCTILAKGEKRPLSEGGSTLPTTGKKFVRTRFIKQGDQGALFAVNHSSGYSTYTDCELIHQGTVPASDFYFNGTIDGVELVIESVTGDSFFTIGGQSGRYSNVYPIRGTGTPEGVVSAPVGSQFMDLAGSAGNVRFLKESGTGNTGWVSA